MFSAVKIQKNTRIPALFRRRARAAATTLWSSSHSLAGHYSFRCVVIVQSVLNKNPKAMTSGLVK